MANYATLKAAIADVIKQNGNNEITGALLQQALLSMITSLGANYQFAGIAEPTTNPGTPDQNVFYIASKPGTYASFDGITIGIDDVSILKYNGSWSKESAGIASNIGGGLNTKKLFCSDSDFTKPLTGIVDYSIDPAIDLSKEYYLKFLGYRDGDKSTCIIQVIDNAGNSYNDSFNGTDNGIHKISVSYFTFIIDASVLPVNNTSVFIQYNYHLVKQFFGSSGIDQLEYDVHGIVKNLDSRVQNHRISEAVKLTGFAGKTVQMVINSSQLGDQFMLYGCTDSGAIDTSIVLAEYTDCGKYTLPFVIPENEYIWIFTLSDTGVNVTYSYKIIDYNSIDNQIRLLWEQLDDLKVSIYGNLYFEDLNKPKTPAMTSRLSYALKLNGKAGIRVYMRIDSEAFQNVENEFQIYGCNNDGTINTNILLATGNVNNVSNDFVIPENEYVWIFTAIDESEYSNARYDIYIVDADSLPGQSFQTAFELEKFKSDVNNLNPFNGKTIVCFGDSITEFKYNGKGYADYLAEISGANVIPVGIGGTMLRQRETPVLNPSTASEAYAGVDIINMVKAACGISFDSTHTYADVVTNAAQYLKDHVSDDNTAIIARLLAIDWSGVDYVTVFAGTNDWTGLTETSEGVSGSTDINTTLGALNVIIQLLLTTYPHLHIYWFTPIVRYYGDGGAIDANFSDVKTVSGKTLKELSADIFNEVKLNHTKVCDLYNNLGWNKYNFSNYFLTTDLTHPYKGFRDLAVNFFKFMQSN